VDDPRKDQAVRGKIKNRRLDRDRSLHGFGIIIGLALT
jgi:hypothetical protein